MSEANEPKPDPATSPPAMNTRGRKADEKANEKANNEDNESNSESINKRKDKDKYNDNYKGKVTKMYGNVFQLPEETRKANQFTLTLEALQDYANIEFDNASDLVPFFDTPCKNASVPTPADEPPLDPSGSLVKPHHRLYIEWKYSCEKYNERIADLKTNKLKLFTTILMQCSPGVETKLKSDTSYDKAKRTNDCEWLLTTLKNICNRFEHTENRFVALVSAKSNLFNYKQNQNQSVADYYEIFKEMLSVLESYGGKLHDPHQAAPTSSSDEMTKLSETEKDSYMRERYAAVLFLKNADATRFEALRLDLSNGFSKGRNEYPTSLVDAYQLLLTHKTSTYKKHTPPTNQHHHGRGRGNGNNSRGRGETLSQANSGRGQQTGGRTGKSMTQVRLILTQAEDNAFFPHGIPKHYILLDSDSTVSIFNNADLLSNIREANEPLYLETNGDGKQTSTLIGTIDGFGDVWYNPDSIANILSLAEVRRLRRVTMDTDITPAFHVHRLNGSGYTVFEEHASGLYLLDTSKEFDNINDNKECVFAYSYLQTVANNKEHYTKRQIDAADKARELYRMLGRPSHQRFIDVLKNNLLINCPITVDDAIRAEHIYGKDVAFLKGKTTADPATDHIPAQPQVTLPPELLSLHTNVTLCFDIFYVLGLPFSLSISRDIRYLSCRALRTRSKAELTQCLRADFQLYKDRGFNPTTVHADGEYNPFKNMFPGIHFSICAADAHVPEIERAIRTVKETVRSTIHGMPYHRLPRVMIRELTSMAVRTLNMLPHADGISPTMSPLSIVTGLPRPDYNTLKLEFGTYVQVYDGTSNDTKSRTLGAIATNPTGNVSGDHFFMSLTTGQRIHRRSWTVVPISDSTVSRVEAIAANENMPLVDTDHMITEYDPDDVVDESIYDRTYQPPPDQPSDHEMTTDAYTDTDDSATDSHDDVGHNDAYDNEPNDTDPTDPLIPTTINSAPHRHVTFNETLNVIHPADIILAAPPTSPPPITNEERPTQPTTSAERQPPKNEERPTQPTTSATRQPPKNEERTPQPPKNEERTLHPRKSGLRPKKDRTYKHRFNFTQLSNNITHALDTLDTAVTPDLQKAIIGLMFTQMSATKGIKKYGQAALDALRKEFEQFKTMDAFEPLDAFTMTDAQKSEALRALSLITEKRDGILKGRTCADGSTQHGKYSKAETGSPTVATDALFLTVLVDAIENRDVATADVKGAYLHAFMKDFISMRFTGWAVDLLCDVNPEYTQYIVYEKNVKVLYVRCNKAIYGCVVSGVLWYELFSTTLEQHGFTVNPYDFCVANAIIDGSQCTITWYVDDTKISHRDPHVVTNIISTLETHFGKMKVTRGHTHEFLGMTITFLPDGTATIHMPSYITNAIADSGLDVTRSSPTPCANNLLEVDPTSPLLPLSQAQLFHSTGAKLIYVGTRARTDILLALGFLCGRVSAPTEQDNKKLRRLLEYLHGTLDLPLHIGADSLDHFTTWVDASFAVHHDMRSHTGGVISFGRGGLLCKSRKQHITTKSSTEAELVGASDYLPNTIYVKEFMASQGYPIRTATFLQDNESAIKLEQNGKASAGQRSRHINIRYFFITDHAQRQSITIKHCPTLSMLADFFTKPLQGSLFKKFRSALLGLVHTNTLLPPP